VPVIENDTAESLSARILVEEHRIYSEAIAMVLAGSWRIVGRRVVADLGSQATAPAPR
jgi:phosphoribosylglycinamide formyltransferase-1